MDHDNTLIRNEVMKSGRLEFPTPSSNHITINTNIIAGSSHVSLYSNASNSYTSGLFPLLALIMTS